MAEKPWCYISLTAKLKVKIDKEDLERVSAHTWRAVKGTQGRLRVVASFRGPDGVRNMTLGRFLMKPPKSKQVYPRRFMEVLDYRKCNLIICTLKERQRLLPKKRSKTSSIYKGVSYQGANRRWRAGIQVGGNSINLGDFDSESEAAKAYNSAAQKFFGVDAYQNQVGRRPNKRRR